MSITQSQHRGAALEYLDAARAHLAAIDVDWPPMESEDELYETFCEWLRQDYAAMDGDDYSWPESDARIIARRIASIGLDSIPETP